MRRLLVLIALLVTGCTAPEDDADSGADPRGHQTVLSVVHVSDAAHPMDVDDAALARAPALVAEAVREAVRTGENVSKQASTNLSSELRVWLEEEWNEQYTPPAQSSVVRYRDTLLRVVTFS